MKRIIVTGSSGYLGRKLVAAFRSRGMTVLGIDLNPVASEGEESHSSVDDSAASAGLSVPDEFHQADIRSVELLEVVQEFRPDTILHAAFIVQPMRDSSLMTDINVGGSQNIIRIVEQVKPQRFLFFSSATAFGAWPDNPIPISDDALVRGRPGYQYADEKAALEADVVELAKRCPDIAVSWVRPPVVGGPGMDNFLSRFIFGFPMLVRLDGKDEGLQFVHEDDVVGAVVEILDADGHGPFNLAPPDHMTIADISKHTNRPSISLPFWLAYFIGWLMWVSRLKISEGPPGFLYFTRYPWVVAPDRLTKEIGYQFQYSSLEAMLETYRHRQKPAAAKASKAG